MTPPAAAPPPDARARDLIRAWRAGATPDAAAAASDPDIRDRPSLVIDLAYEEYCLREAAGAAPDASRFSAAFGSLRAEIRDVIDGHRILAACPGVLAPPAWPEVGDDWDGFRFVRDLGRGAFARVYLVEDRSVARTVVLKLSRQPSGEGRSLGRLGHPNVVDVLWSRAVRGFHAVAMPFVATATLRRAVDAAFAGPGRPPRIDPFLWPRRATLTTSRGGPRSCTRARGTCPACSGWPRCWPTASPTPPPAA